MYDIPLFPDSLHLPVSERIVAFLAQNLPEVRRHIIVDNCYLSTRLAQYLLRHNIYITGRQRANRRVPQYISSEDFPKGS